MYTDEDLDTAVEKGIFTNSSVEEFRNLLPSIRRSSSVDEENFKLIGGFNDIFIVIASALLLFSSLWVLDSVNKSLSWLVFTILSWLLAEFFVRKRKMALPAIVLLLSFIGGICGATLSVFSSTSETALITAAALSGVAAYGHWLRFRVPVTVAVGTAAGIGFLVSVGFRVFPDTADWLLALLFICGLVAFSLAMYWDSSDTDRTTYKSDVAFWLHLISAPLIIHPVFSGLGVLSGSESALGIAIIIALYLLMTSISITIDRRAFMVSSLLYVIYAISKLIESYGGVGYSFALTGVFMGAALLLLSAYWHPTRKVLVRRLPTTIESYVPRVKTG